MKKIFESRGIKSAPLLAHSYERVMPGKNYVASIRDFWRVCSGINAEARQQSGSQRALHRHALALEPLRRLGKAGETQQLSFRDAMSSCVQENDKLFQRVKKQRGKIGHHAGSGSPLQPDGVAGRDHPRNGRVVSGKAVVHPSPTWHRFPLCVPVSLGSGSTGVPCHDWTTPQEEDS